MLEAQITKQPGSKRTGMRWSVFTRVAGVLLLAAASAMIYHFVENPRGTLPVFTQAWSGGPLILGAAFLSMCGTYLIAMRRFSLAGFVVAGLASGALATGAHAYVSSITEIARAQDSVQLDPEKTQEFVERSRRLLTPERLKALAVDLKLAGYLEKRLDFDSVNVLYGAPKEGNDLIVTINFAYSPYLCARSTGARSIVAAYVRLLNAWNVARIQHDDGAWVRAAASAIYQHLHPRWWNARFDKEQQRWFDLQFFEQMGKLCGSKPEPFRSGLFWLRDREPDVEFKAFLDDICRELKSLESDRPIILSGC